MKELTDEQLMARCASGDREAMDMLVSRYHGKLIDFAFRHIGNRETAADIAQTTLIRVFESAAGYRFRASFKTWMYTITVNLVRDEMRRRKIRKESLSTDLKSDEIPESGRLVFEKELLDRMLAEQIWQAIGDLPEDQQIAFTLRFRHDLTYEEIARVMKVPEGTVKSWIHYSLKKLRANLQPVKCEG